MRRALVAFALVAASCSSQSAEKDPFDGLYPQMNAPERVGEDVHAGLSSPAGSGLVWRHEIRDEGATYLCPHFSQMDLPLGARLVVRSEDGARVREYAGHGRNGGEFWAIHVPGETLVVELWSDVELAAGAVVLDRYARGFPVEDHGGHEAICGTDDSRWAKCYAESEPQVYAKSRAVIRLLIGGSSACTGWLVGSEGHVMTNEHCIGNASDAANTNFEIMAEGATCATSCTSFGACPGTIVADGSSLVKLSATYDYALVKLPVNPSSEYGFLQLRASGAVAGERIYIPEHPGAQGKKIAVESTHSTDTGGVCRVASVNASACAGGSRDIGYFADTQGGSSGSPVLGYGDHLVVALHHCGSCANVGVPIEHVIADLGSSLPASALPGGNPTPTPTPTSTPSPTPTPAPDQTAPSFGALSPMHDAVIAANTTVAVSAAISDDTGVTAARLYWWNAGTWKYFDCASPPSHVTCTQSNGTWTWNVPVGSGTRWWIVRAYDGAGRVSDSELRRIYFQ